MTEVSMRRAQALGREDVLAHVVKALEAVETWADYDDVLRDLRYRHGEAVAAIRALA